MILVYCLAGYGWALFILHLLLWYNNVAWERNHRTWVNIVAPTLIFSSAASVSWVVASAIPFHSVLFAGLGMLLGLLMSKLSQGKEDCYKGCTRQATGH